jgi:hypothetical protein
MFQISVGQPSGDWFSFPVWIPVITTLLSTSFLYWKTRKDLRLEMQKLIFAHQKQSNSEIMHLVGKLCIIFKSIGVSKNSDEPIEKYLLLLNLPSNNAHAVEIAKHLLLLGNSVCPTNWDQTLLKLTQSYLNSFPAQT